MDTRGVSQRQLAALLLVCLALAAWYVWQLPGAWHEWRVWVSDRYPGQHRGRVLGMMDQPEERIAIFEGYMSRQRRLAADGRRRAAYPERADAPRPSRPDS
jgi:hypothetical protein